MDRRPLCCGPFSTLRARSFFCEAPIKHKTFLHYKNVMSATRSKRLLQDRALKILL
jgi:hypothetical protein